MSSGCHRKSLVAFAATCALMVCAAVYSAHGVADRTHEHSHCDLCVHFSGTAGSPAHAAAVGKPVLVVRVAPTRAEIILPTRSPLGVNLPRGPPLGLSVI
ncbi:MAG TPA: hypothetical protein VGD47_07595 [Steroidobacteraceae bacterium]